MEDVQFVVVQAGYSQLGASIYIRPPSTTLGPVKVLHFSKYGDNVSEMTVTDKF